MEVELIHVLMSSISSLSIREIRLTTNGKLSKMTRTSAKSENPVGQPVKQVLFTSVSQTSYQTLFTSN